MGQISQYTISAWSAILAVTPVRLDGGSRTIIRADGNDIRIAYTRDLLGSDLDGSMQNQYFTIKDGEAFVFDANPVTGVSNPELDSIFYMTVASGADATVQVWLQGKTQMM